MLKIRQVRISLSLQTQSQSPTIISLKKRPHRHQTKTWNVAKINLTSSSRITKLFQYRMEWEDCGFAKNCPWDGGGTDQ